MLQIEQFNFPYQLLSLLLLVRHVADVLGGVTGPQLTIGNDQVRQHNSTGCDDDIVSDVTSLLYDGALADEGVVANGGGGDQRSVTDCASVADVHIRRKSRLKTCDCINHSSILHIGERSNLDDIFISSQNSPIPNLKMNF